MKKYDYVSFLCLLFATPVWAGALGTVGKLTKAERAAKVAAAAEQRAQKIKRAAEKIELLWFGNSRAVGHVSFAKKPAAQAEMKKFIQDHEKILKKAEVATTQEKEAKVLAEQKLLELSSINSMEIEMRNLPSRLDTFYYQEEQADNILKVLKTAQGEERVALEENLANVDCSLRFEAASSERLLARRNEQISTLKKIPNMNPEIIQAEEDMAVNLKELLKKQYNLIGEVENKLPEILREAVKLKMQDVSRP